MVGEKKWQALLAENEQYKADHQRQMNRIVELEREIVRFKNTLEREKADHRAYIAKSGGQIGSLKKALNEAECDAEFFKSEVKLRNRIPVTNVEQADRQRRIESLEALLIRAQTIIDPCHPKLHEDWQKDARSLIGKP